MVSNILAFLNNPVAIGNCQSTQPRQRESDRIVTREDSTQTDVVSVNDQGCGTTEALTDSIGFDSYLAGRFWKKCEESLKRNRTRWCDCKICQGVEFGKMYVNPQCCLRRVGGKAQTTRVRPGTMKRLSLNFGGKIIAVSPG